MAEILSRPKRDAQVFGVLLGMVLVGLAGQLCLLRIGEGLARLSYDVPFFFSSRPVPSDLVMVYSDAPTKQRLGQPPGEDLDRRYCVQLLDRLTRDGARLVLFDLLFDYPSAQPGVDADFAAALRAHGQVVLIGDFATQVQGSAMTSSALPPIVPLASAAAGWGLARITRDSDLFVRRLDSGNEVLPSAGWVAGSLLAAPATQSPEARATERWLNYYCRPSELPAVYLDLALESNGLAPDFFRNKIVIVGGRAGEGALAGARSDEFFTPFSRSPSEPPAAGATIHAFTLLNLLHGDWLTRLGFGWESLLFWLWGALITVILLWFRAWPAIGAALLAAGGFAVIAMYGQIHQRLWFAWLVPVAVQTPMALVWSVGYQYAVEARRRQKLRQAFAVYCSPYMADRIANSEFDLSLGGREVQATVMFTDLEGYATLAETLPPAEVSQLLTSYFTETTRAILEQDGTIIKYMGDAVMAVWGAPMAVPHPAQQAVLAALGMRAANHLEFRGHRLRTRIGINSGIVLAGNLGSSFRFDYTCIGEATNLASRLEGLNKYLGTDILVSAATQAELSGITTRYLGQFRPAGKTQATGLYEVLGLAGEFNPAPEWLPDFERAMQAFQQGQLDVCEQWCRRVLTLRAADGPATFYLGEVKKARARADRDGPWNGVVVFDSK